MLNNGLIGRLLHRVRGKEALLLILLGVIVRYLWLAERGETEFAGGEAANVAIALARDGAVADTFARGSGLSTHFVPSMVLITGAVYALLGVRSVASELVLSAFSIGLSLGGGYLWYRIAVQLGVPVKHALIALAVFCLFPLDFFLQVVSFRAWEGALAVFLGALCVSRVVDLDRAEGLSTSAFLPVALLAAITFFVNQALGLAVYASLGLLLLRRCPWRAWATKIGVAAVCLVAVLAPWTVRNYVHFDRFIPLRSNFGLELALANHGAAVSGERQRKVFVDRLQEIHPQESQAAFDRMIAVGGEIPYAAGLGAEAQRWIADHPAEFARLSLRHLRQFYFPPDWFYDIYGGNARAVGPRQVFTWAVSAAGLLAALLLPWIYGWRQLYLAIAVLVPSLPYMIAQPVPRYRYLVLVPLLFASVALAGWIVARLGRGRRRPAMAEA